jgi:hypothetical protein
MSPISFSHSAATHPALIALMANGALLLFLGAWLGARAARAQMGSRQRRAEMEEMELYPPDPPKRRSGARRWMIASGAVIASFAVVACFGGAKRFLQPPRPPDQAKAWAQAAASLEVLAVDAGGQRAVVSSHSGHSGHSGKQLVSIDGWRSPRTNVAKPAKKEALAAAAETKSKNAPWNALLARLSLPPLEPCPPPAKPAIGWRERLSGWTEAMAFKVNRWRETTPAPPPAMAAHLVAALLLLVAWAAWSQNTP